MLCVYSELVANSDLLFFFFGNSKAVPFPVVLDLAAMFVVVCSV